MTVTAFEKAGSLDSEKFRKVVRNTRFEGLVYGNGISSSTVQARQNSRSR